MPMKILISYAHGFNAKDIHLELLLLHVNDWQLSENKKEVGLMVRILELHIRHLDFLCYFVWSQEKKM